MIIKTTPQIAKRLFPDYDKRFKLVPNYIAYSLIKNEIPVSVLCVSISKGKIKFHACFTPIVFRKKGYFKELLKGVICEYPDKMFFADCLPESVGVFMSCGFELKKKKYNKGWTLYIMERRGNGEICN